MATVSSSKASRLARTAGRNINESIGVRKQPRPREAKSPATVRPARGVVEIPLEQLQRDPKQPRRVFDEEALERLALALKTRGQLQPIRVLRPTRGTKYTIVAGERRWRAAKVGLETLLCVVVDKRPTEAEHRADQLAENCAREDLAPLDLALALSELASTHSWSQRQISHETGLSQSSVSKALELLELAEPVRELVADGKLAAATAYELRGLDTFHQVEIGGRAVAEGLTRDQVRDAIKAGLRPAPVIRGESEMTQGECVSQVKEDLSQSREVAEKPRKKETFAVCLKGKEPTYFVIAEDQDDAEAYVRSQHPGDSKLEVRPYFGVIPSGGHWVRDITEGEFAGPERTPSPRREDATPEPELKALVSDDEPEPNAVVKRPVEWIVTDFGSKGFDTAVAFRREGFVVSVLNQPGCKVGLVEALEKALDEAKRKQSGASAFEVGARVRIKVKHRYQGAVGTVRKLPGNSNPNLVWVALEIGAATPLNLPFSPAEIELISQGEFQKGLPKAKSTRRKRA